MDREKALNRLRGLDLYGLAEEDILALHTLIPELIESEDERIRKEISNLYSDIDGCITELLKARTNKDSEAEGKALFKMEGIMVGTLQDLSCIEDYLEKQKEQKPAEWSEEDEKKMIFLERLIEHNVPDGQYGWADGRKDGFVTKSEAISMLKSLRPSWKPSEEQMGALSWMLENARGNIDFDPLKDLYEQLSKL